jgi:DNA polymerase-3 subunit alpha
VALARFVHLHNHSEYSLLDGAIRVTDLAETAKAMGMGAIALTDHGNLFGAIPFVKAAAAAGVKPIVGMETYVAEGGIAERSRGPGQARNDHLTLLVRNEEGYRNLIKLTSIAYLEGFYYRPRVDYDLLGRYHGGLVAMSGCLQGAVARLLLADKRKEAAELCERLVSIFGQGSFYLEMQNHGIAEELTVIPRIAELAATTRLPTVATNDCHFLRAEDHRAHDVLLCLQTGKELEDPTRQLRSNPETYVKSPEQMATLFAEHPAALASTEAIVEMCDFRLPEGEQLLPRFPIPQPYTSAKDYLEHLVMESLPKRVPAVTEEVLARARYELDVIARMGFEGYFLVVWDIVRAARERGIPVGPGRGSGAGSLVCYALGITGINPMEHGLLFERLLNPERVSMPDIDVDFCDERRQEVIEYVVGKYGKDNVCQIITFGRMAARAVVRDVGRVLKVPYGDIDKLAKMIPGGPGVTLTKALATVPELDARYRDDPAVKRLIDLSLSLEGLARHASTHAAGIVITPTALTDHVPLFRTNKGEVTTQYEMKILEDMGMLKIDILGLKTLSQIKGTIDLVEKHEGVRIDPDAIPLEDPDTYELLRRGQTVGVFQLESAGMRELLRKIGPTTFGDVTAINALYRPGPLGSDMISDFIECKHGKKKIAYEDPRLEPILAETYGVILYQEQVMRVASDLAGFTLGQADILRRAMGKKKKDVMERQREQFIAGAVARGLSKKKAVKIFDLINYFSGYGFNKSHSAAYAVVSVQTAYLKAHHPAAFMAASMTCDMSDTDRLMVLLDECRSLGLGFHPPDVNSGGVGFGLANGEITYGLAAIKNVGAQAIESIVAARGNRVFTDLYDFCERVDSRVVNRRVMENLIQSGATDSLPGTRAQKMATLDRILAQAQRRQSERERGQTFLGFLEGGAHAESFELENVPDWDESVRLHREKESLGFYFSGHPLERYADMLGTVITATTATLAEKRDREPVVLAGLVGEVKVILDRKGNPMAFATIEDMHGSLEVIVFSDCFQKRRAKLQQDAIVVVSGKVSIKGQGDVKVIADEIYTVEEAIATLARKLHLTIRPEVFGPEGFKRVKQTLERFPGEREVVFHVRGNGGERAAVRSRAARIAPRLELLEELGKIAGVEHVEVSY